MIQFDISTEDLTAMAAKLKKLPDFAGTAAKDVAITLRRLVKGRTPVGKTRVLKNSWTRTTKEATGYSFSNDTPYAHVLEQGLYPSVGPRTGPGKLKPGVYSIQAPDGMIYPIITDDTIITEVVKGVLEAMAKGAD